MIVQQSVLGLFSGGEERVRLLSCRREDYQLLLVVIVEGRLLGIREGGIDLLCFASDAMGRFFPFHGLGLSRCHYVMSGMDGKRMSRMMGDWNTNYF